MRARCAHIDSGQRFSQRADLVDLDQQRIAAAARDAIGQTDRVGHEQIVAHQLDLGPQRVGQQFPAVPIVFGAASSMLMIG